MSQLSDLKIRKAQPNTNAYTLADGEGLFLHITPNGSKIWHFRFYWQNRQQRISFGNYPAVDLRTARTLRQDAQSQLARGIDPRDERKAAKAVIEKKLTFAEFAQTWMDFKLKRIGAGKSPNGRQSTIVQLRRYMHKDFLPVLGKMALTDITRADVVKIIRNIEARGSLAIAVKCRGWLNEMFRHALAEGLVQSNLAADLDIVSLPKPVVQHNPYLKMDEMPAFMAALSRYPGHTQTAMGIRLLLLTGVRTGELRYAEPQQFDLENAVWRIPAHLVKQLQRRVRTVDANIPPYLVPLSRQAIEIVQKLMDMRYPWQQYLLCHQTEPKKVISENTLNYGIRRMGYKNHLTGHGIRATISTALNEMGYDSKWIEAQLSHSDPNSNNVTTLVSKFYNHAEYVEQRRGMMQDWADKLDQWEAEGLAQNQIGVDQCQNAEESVEESEEEQEEEPAEDSLKAA